MSFEAAALRELGADLQDAVNLGAESGGSGLRRAADNNLIRVYETASPFAVRNPLASPAAIELDVRRVDLPADWMVAVTPTSVTLAAGAQTTATLTVRAETAAVQNTRPRVAVEGFANGQLIGGVVLDELLPQQAALWRSDATRWRLFR